MLANTLDRIISTVLGWDISELKKRAAAVEKDKNAPGREQLRCLKEYPSQSAEKHDECRKESSELPHSRNRNADLTFSTSPSLSFYCDGNSGQVIMFQQYVGAAV